MTKIRACFLSLAQSKLRLWQANHWPGYWSYLPCDWLSTAWAYSEQETENGPWYPYLLWLTWLPQYHHPSEILFTSGCRQDKSSPYIPTQRTYAPMHVFNAFRTNEYKGTFHLGFRWFPYLLLLFYISVIGRGLLNGLGERKVIWSYLYRVCGVLVQSRFGTSWLICLDTVTHYYICEWLDEYV